MSILWPSMHPVGATSSSQDFELGLSTSTHLQIFPKEIKHKLQKKKKKKNGMELSQ